MRTLIALSLLAAAVLAQDRAAADLFYRGYWLEQAGGRLDDAEALYAELLEKHAGAPEAPRALVGLLRIRAARGEDVAPLLARLEREHPGAEEELAEARRLAAAHDSRFDPRIEAGDAPATVRIKELYFDLLESGVALEHPDQLFLVDLGAAAHPMLAAALRAHDAAAVEAAATILVKQQLPEAERLLARALLDPAVLYTDAVLKGLRWEREAPATLVEALAQVADGAPPRLRRNAVATIADLAATGRGEGATRAFAVLTRRVDDEDREVRAAASAAVLAEAAPDAYLDAVLRRIEADDPAVPKRVRARLYVQGHRAALAERIRNALRDVDLEPKGEPHGEAGAVLLMRAALAQIAAGRDDPYTAVWHAAHWSPRAAAEGLRAALARDDRRIADHAVPGAQAGDRTLRGHLGEQAQAILIEALRAGRVAGEKRGGRAAERILRDLPPTPADLPAILAAWRDDRGRGLPVALADDDYLRRLEPARAAALAELCTTGVQVEELLEEGLFFMSRPDHGLAFFEAVVPRAGPECAGDLARLRTPELARLVAERLLEARGEEWGWAEWRKAPRRRSYRTTTVVDGVQVEQVPPVTPPLGPDLWFRRALREACLRDPLRARLLDFVDDPREVVAQRAVEAAERAGAEGALVRALASPHASLRGAALRVLARDERGPAVLAAFARRDDLESDDRQAVGEVLEAAEGEAFAALARELLETRSKRWAGLWPAYHRLAPDAAVDFALAEATGAGAPAHRRGAVRLLTTVAEPRRIEVFRRVLATGDRDAIGAVVTAVRDQYLVELGVETLEQLRSPDPAIRGIAHEAVEKLKFYAEAKKAFTSTPSGGR